MARYSIMIREYGLAQERELCACNTNPLAIVEAARQRTHRQTVGTRRVVVARYDHVYARDNETGERVKEDA